MMTKIKELIIKYKEIIIYVIFGGLTTVVNLSVFTLFNKLLGDERYLITNIVAWFAAVAFSYITNKIWVFESKSWNIKVLAKEILSFFAARVLTLGIEEAGLFVFVDLLSFNEISLKVFGRLLLPNKSSNFLDLFKLELLEKDKRELSSFTLLLTKFFLDFSFFTFIALN